MPRYTHYLCFFRIKMFVIFINITPNAGIRQSLSQRKRTCAASRLILAVTVLLGRDICAFTLLHVPVNREYSRSPFSVLKSAIIDKISKRSFAERVWRTLSLISPIPSAFSPSQLQAQMWRHTVPDTKDCGQQLTPLR